MTTKEIFSYLLFSSAALYGIYLWVFDCREKPDERRQLIRMKALQLGHKLTTVTLVILAAINCFIYPLSAHTVLAVAIVVGLYAEIALKSWYNRQM